MQGLADGYFVIPATVSDYIAQTKAPPVGSDHAEVRAAEERVNARTDRFLAMQGTKPVDHYHRLLGRIMWDKCGMSRTESGLQEAITRIRELREEFWSKSFVGGSGTEINQELEKAGRVADFFEFAELMCIDALQRNESCGGHFRAEYQTDDGEALRDDENYCHVSAWGWGGDPMSPQLNVEPLNFESVHLATRSYK
jgi:succinate dehydrogenase / fumarate reductase flavoprotein subunit